MSWNIKTPGDYINGPLTVAGAATFNSTLTVSGVSVFNTNVGIGASTPNVNSNRTTLTLQGAWGGQIDINVGAVNHAQFGTDNFSSGLSCRIQSADGIIFKGAAGAELMRVISTGLGLGVVPNTKLHVLMPDAATADLARFQQTNQGNLLIQSQQGGQSLGGANGILFSNAVGRMGFRTAASSGDAQMLLDTNGNVLVGLTGGNANGGCLQLKSGITLPATQVASTDANTLDDYEEGTFTPTIVGTSTAGTANYVVRLGSYTKVGRVVQFQIHLAWNTGTGTGNLRVSGLPFTANGTYVAVPNVYPIDISLVAGFYATASIQPSTDQLNIYQLPTGGGSDGTVAYDAAGQLIITGTYIV